jgi:hypothetical protein
MFSQLLKNVNIAKHWWLTPVILVTWRIKRIAVEACPDK